ncbi:hypothetical protein P7C70_g6395, partial [Phenoliferia sp. Uapishka_3]
MSFPSRPFFNTEVSSSSFYASAGTSPSCRQPGRRSTADSDIENVIPAPRVGLGPCPTPKAPVSASRMALGSILNREPSPSHATSTATSPFSFPSSSTSPHAPNHPHPGHRRAASLLHLTYPPPPAWAFDDHAPISQAAQASISPGFSTEWPATLSTVTPGGAEDQGATSGGCAHKGARGGRGSGDGSETEVDDGASSDEGGLAGAASRFASGSQSSQRKRALRKENTLEEAAWRHKRPLAEMMETIDENQWRCKRCRRTGPIFGGQFVRHYKSGKCDQARRREAKKPESERPPLSVSPQKRGTDSNILDSPTSPSRNSLNQNRVAQVPVNRGLRAPPPQLIWTSAVARPPSRRLRCVGARIKFFEGAIPTEEYVWKRNRDEDEVWRVIPVGGELFAKSLECSGERRVGESACWRCTDVLKHRKIARLQVRRTASEVHGVRLDERSHRELQDLVHEHQRAESANFLKVSLHCVSYQASTHPMLEFQNSNLQRSLERATFRNIIFNEMFQQVREMDAKFRVSAVIGAGLDAGRSWGWIMRSLIRAKEGKLKIARWTQEEIDASMIVDIIGKSRATAATQHLGGPARTFLRERRQKCHLLPGIGNEEQHVAIMLANLDTLGFTEPPADQPDLPPVETFTIGSDEVSSIPGLELCHRIDAFVGLAIETMWHSSLDVNFRNMESAVSIWDALNGSAPTQQLVANIKCVALLRQDKVEYQAMPIFFGGHAKSGRDWNMERRIFSAIEPPLARRMRRRGWVYVGTASDGDRPRQLFEAKRCCEVEVTPGHELHKHYSEMKGITPRVGVVEGRPVMRRADARHNIKCGRAALARPNGITVGVVTVRPETYVGHLKMEMPDIKPQRFLNALLPPDPMCVAPAVTSFQFLFALGPSSSLSLMIPPIRHQQRHALNWIAVPYRALLRPFVEADLSLSEGMTSWSKGGWAHFIGHILNPVDGLPSDGIQNWLSTVQATFTHLITRKEIAVARGIRLDFFICLEGENEIEALFAAAKLAGGTDTGLTPDRFARLAGEGLELNRIYARFPHFRKGQKGTRNLSTATGADHCSPHWLTGDSDVRNVDIVKCWNTGRAQAFDEARQNPLFGAEWVSQLERELEAGERDFQRPFGFYLKWDHQEQLDKGVALRRELDVAAESQRYLSGETGDDRAGGGGAELSLEESEAALLASESSVRAQLIAADPSLQDDTSTTDPNPPQLDDFDPAAFVAGLTADKNVEVGHGLGAIILVHGMMDDPDDADDPELTEEMSVVYVDELDEFGDGEDDAISDSDHEQPRDPTQPLFPEPPSGLPVTGHPVYRTVADLFPNSTDAKPLPTRAQRRAAGPRVGPQTEPKRSQVETEPGRWASKITVTSQLNRPNGRPAMMSKDRATKQGGRSTGSQATENRRNTLGMEIAFQPDNFEPGDEVAVLVSQGGSRFLLIAELHALNLRKGGRAKDPYTAFASSTIAADNAYVELKISELHTTTEVGDPDDPRPLPPATWYHTWGSEYVRDENDAVCAIEVPARNVIKIQGKLVTAGPRVVIEYSEQELASTLQKLVNIKPVTIPTRWPGPYTHRAGASLRPRSSQLRAQTNVISFPAPLFSTTSPTTSSRNSTAKSASKEKKTTSTQHPCAQCGDELSPAALKIHVSERIIRGYMHPAACAFCGSMRCQFHISVGGSGGDISAVTAQSLTGRQPAIRRAQVDESLVACDAFLKCGCGTTKSVCGTSKKAPSSNGPLVCLHCDSTQRKKTLITRYGARTHYSTAHAEIQQPIIFTVQQRGTTRDIGLDITQEEYDDVIALEEKRLKQKRTRGATVPVCQSAQR